LKYILNKWFTVRFIINITAFRVFLKLKFISWKPYLSFVNLISPRIVEQYGASIVKKEEILENGLKTEPI
jgi:hypothetical protein